MDDRTVTVTPVLRSCQGCKWVRRDTEVVRPGAPCALCVGLVQDQTGTLWVYSGGLDNGQPARVPREKLSPAPRQLT